MICIIGAGLAGDTAAATLREEGYEGRIVLISDEPHAPYDRPPLSKDALYDDGAEERLFLRPAGWYDAKDMELLTGRAVAAIDADGHKLTFSDGETLVFEKLLIATGARARNLPGADALAIPSFVVRTLDDARGLKAALQPGKRALVIGAGVIGLEVAASAARLGCSVDVVDMLDRVMSRVVPPAISDLLAKLHRDHDVRLHLDAGQVTLTGAGVDTEKHGSIAADLIIVGIGVVPNIELADAAGIRCDDGIIVDSHCQTSAADIYAVGDCARYPCPFGSGMIRSENWKHAQNQAAVAARNMLGKVEDYANASSMWSDQFDVKLQTVGFIADSGEILRGDPASGKFMHIYRDADGVVVGALGINQAKDMRFIQDLIEKRIVAAPELLADPKQNLRKLAK